MYGFKRDMVRPVFDCANAKAKYFCHYDKEVRPYKQNVFGVLLAIGIELSSLLQLTRVSFLHPLTCFKESCTSPSAKGSNLVNTAY